MVFNFAFILCFGLFIPSDTFTYKLMFTIRFIKVRDTEGVCNINRHFNIK